MAGERNPLDLRPQSAKALDWLLQRINTRALHPELRIEALVQQANGDAIQTIQRLHGGINPLLVMACNRSEHPRQRLGRPAHHAYVVKVWVEAEDSAVRHGTARGLKTQYAAPGG